MAQEFITSAQQAITNDIHKKNPVDFVISSMGDLNLFCIEIEKEGLLIPNFVMNFTVLPRQHQQCICYFSHQLCRV